VKDMVESDLELMKMNPVA